VRQTPLKTGLFHGKQIKLSQQLQHGNITRKATLNGYRHPSVK